MDINKKQERIQKALKTRAETLRLHPEILVNAGKNISKAKKGKFKTKQAALKSAKIRSIKLKKIYEQKRLLIGNKNKLRKVCSICNIEFFVQPSRKNRKFCSKKCRVLERTGKAHLNWNPNSMLKSGRGISGTYKNILFRSSFELSFVVSRLLLNLLRLDLQIFLLKTR